MQTLELFDQLQHPYDMVVAALCYGDVWLLQFGTWMQHKKWKREKKVNWCEYTVDSLMLFTQIYLYFSIFLHLCKNLISSVVKQYKMY